MPPINLCHRRPGDRKEAVKEKHVNQNNNCAHFNTTITKAQTFRSDDLQSDISQAVKTPWERDILKENMYTINKYMTEPKNAQSEQEINKKKEKMDSTHKNMNEPMLCREEIDRHFVEMYINKKRVQTEAKSGSKIDQKEEEELYQKKNFVADSVTSVTATRTKVTANGEMRTDPVQGVKPRHLNASPKLPSLRERTSKSKNTELYDLSMRLQDNEPSRIEEENPETVVFEKKTSGEMIASRNRSLAKVRVRSEGKVRVKKVVRETYVEKNDVPNLLNKKRVVEEAYVKKRDEPNLSAMPEQKLAERSDKVVEKTYVKKSDKPNLSSIPEQKFSVTADKKEVVENTFIGKNDKPNPSAMPEQKFSVTADKPKPTKSEETTEKPVTMVNPREKETNFVDHSSRPESSPSKMTPEKCLDSEVYGDLKYFKATAGEADIALTKSFDHWPKKVIPKTICKPKSKPKSTSFSSWAAEGIQNIVDVIDYYSAYKFIILFGISFYLWFILCYDVNKNVSEEWRYVSKMKNSGILMKVFYYVMRKMRIPIF